MLDTADYDSINGSTKMAENGSIGHRKMQKLKFENFAFPLGPRVPDFGQLDMFDVAFYDIDLFLII